jgi:uncharacterized protein (DUF1697 family)
MMTTFIALLRAINVGGSGKLPMADLRSMCVEAGFADVETYIASGNVVFTSPAKSATAKAVLESLLRDHAGKPVGVAIRTATELSAILKQNPFPSNEPRHTYVIFLDERPPRSALDHATGRVDEDMRLGKREIYVAYPNGMGRSKLRIPAAKLGTARNLNTVAALVEIASRK